MRECVFISVQQQTPERLHHPRLIVEPQFLQHPLPLSASVTTSHPIIPRLCGSDGAADLRATLSGGQADLFALDDLGTLLDDLLTLGQDELDVAGVGHVGVDLEIRRLVFIPAAIAQLNPVVYIHDRGHGRCVSGPWEPG